MSDDCCEIDGLGRHDAYCQRASQLGLPKRAEGEEPVEDQETELMDQPVQGDEADEPHDERDTAQEHTIPDPNDRPKECVACLEYHIFKADEEGAIAVGRSLVHEDCAWRVHYLGVEAHRVISVLEQIACEGATRGEDPESVRQEVHRIARENGWTTT